MKAYDITKLTAELKNDNVQYRNKKYITRLVVLVGVPTGTKATYKKLIYRTTIVGRRQVAIGFMN